MELTETRITSAFILLAIVLWLGMLQVTDDWLAQAAVLFMVGIIIPTVINQYRRRS